MRKAIEEFLKNISVAKLVLAGAITLFSAAIAVSATVYAFLEVIDSRVEKALDDDRVLKRLAVAVRPSLLFNLRGAITSDAGASDVIQSINVSFKTNILEIEVTPNRHLSREPIIEPLNIAVEQIQVRRSKGFAWLYEFAIYPGPQPGTYEGMLASKISEDSEFRLDVLY